MPLERKPSIYLYLGDATLPVRMLLYVPILHAEADMGSSAPALSRHSIALCGAKRWAQHQEVVLRFWQSLADFFRALDPAPLGLYQDGLTTEGEAARRLVAEAARRGSPNYRLLLELVQRGAQLRKTEDPALIMAERQTLLQMLEESVPGKGEEVSTQGDYQEGRDHLRQARDHFIAKTINETLPAGELGVLFLGAHHDVAPFLDSDIEVQWIKEPETVRAYFQTLFFERNEDRWQALAAALTSPLKSNAPFL